MRATRENRAEKRCQPKQVQPSNTSGRNEYVKQNAGMQEQAPLVSNPKRSKRNPLRGHLNALSVAIVEANKLDHYIDDDALEWIRKGEAAARTLAEELARPFGHRRERAPLRHRGYGSRHGSRSDRIFHTIGPIALTIGGMAFLRK